MKLGKLLMITAMSISTGIQRELEGGVAKRDYVPLSVYECPEADAAKRQLFSVVTAAILNADDDVTIPKEAIEALETTKDGLGYLIIQTASANQPQALLELACTMLSEEEQEEAQEAQAAYNQLLSMVEETSTEWVKSVQASWAQRIIDSQKKKS